MVVARGPHRIDGWWNRSTAGFEEVSLGRHEPKEPSKDETLEKAPALRPVSIVDAPARGIRMALGAEQRELTGMFVGHGLLLTGVGVAWGLGTAFALMHLMSSLLFKVTPVDPLTYGAACLGLIATAVLASYPPSRRGT
jgi:hypothetical protein